MARTARAALALIITGSLLCVGFMNGARASGLDEAFGGRGIVTTNFFDYPDPNGSYGSRDSASDLVIQPDGKIVVVGNTGKFYPDWDFAVVRYNRNGSLDKSFDVDGRQTINMRVGSAEAVALQPDGKIVVAGSQNTSGQFLYTESDFVLARLNSNGSLDQTFGRGGKVTANFFHNFDRAYDVAVQTDGKIIVAGEVMSDNPRGYYFGVARYNTDGSPDDGSGRDSTPSDSFGTRGRITDNFGGSATARAIVIQPDGKIVVAGTAFSPTDTTYPYDSDFILARYLSDGRPDTTFGAGGHQTTTFTGDGGNELVGIALQPDGKIVAAGNSGEGVALARYNSDGSLDNSFDGDGRQMTDFLNGVVADIAIMPGGKIVVAGTNPDPHGVVVLCCVNPRDFALARFNPDGSVDTTFDGDGELTSDFLCGHFGLYPYITGSVEVASAIAAQPDGKVVVVGDIYWGSRSGLDFAVARYPVDPTSYYPPLSFSVKLPRQYINNNITFATVLGSESLTGRIELCAPALSDTVITLDDNLASADVVPQSVTIPAGRLVAGFEIKTTPVSALEAGTITATVDALTKSAPLRVLPIKVSSLTLSQTLAQGPRTITGIVELDHPAFAGGLAVTLSSSDPTTAYPTTSELVFPQGATSRSFTIRVNDVPSPRLALIKARANGTIKTQILSVR